MKDDTSPDWENAALLTIDVQKSFALPGACAEIPGTWEVIPKIQQLLQAFRQSGKPIIHVIRIYLPDGSNVDLCRRQDIKNGKQVAIPGDVNTFFSSSFFLFLGDLATPVASPVGDAALTSRGTRPRRWLVYVLRTRCANAVRFSIFCSRPI